MAGAAAGGGIAGATAGGLVLATDAVTDEAAIGWTATAAGVAMTVAAAIDRAAVLRIGAALIDGGGIAHEAAIGRAADFPLRRLADALTLAACAIAAGICVWAALAVAAELACLAADVLATGVGAWLRAAGVAIGAEIGGGCFAALAIGVALASDAGGGIESAAFVLGRSAAEVEVRFRTTEFVWVVFRTAGEGVGIVDADETDARFTGVGAGLAGQTTFVANPAGVDPGIVRAADLGGGVAVGVPANMVHTGSNYAVGGAGRWGVAIAVDAALGRLTRIDAGVVVGAAIAADGGAGTAPVGAFGAAGTEILDGAAGINTTGAAGADRLAATIDEAADITVGAADIAKGRVADPVGGIETAGARVGGATAFFAIASALATGIVTTGGIAGGAGSDSDIVAAGRSTVGDTLRQPGRADTFRAIPGLIAGAFGRSRGGGRAPGRL